MKRCNICNKKVTKATSCGTGKYMICVCCNDKIKRILEKMEKDEKERVDK